MTKGAQMQFTHLPDMYHKGLYVFLHSNSDAIGAPAVRGHTLKLYTTFMASIASEIGFSKYKISKYFLKEFHLMSKEEKDFTM